MCFSKTLYLVAAFMFCAVTIASASTDDIMIEDFEGSDYGRWQVTGEAFGTGPAHGPLGDQPR
jgi:hypothetical protein